MHRLCSLLGMPQNRFASIHVVGTNGKTSVTLMTAALLEAQGVRTGAYTSPHILDWRERIRIGGEPISEEALTRALERAEQSAQVADRAAGDEGPVTQYELLTAAAFIAFAEAKVEFAVIEAGLGGRLDATNVIPSRLTVLTSVGLDHTEWLGETLEEIATEKLAVLRDHTPLVTGPLAEEIGFLVHRVLEQAHSPSLNTVASDGGTFHTLNYRIACEAVEKATGREVWDRRGQAEAASDLTVPGRAELIPGDPPELFDAAHNPEGARALAESLPALVSPRRRLWRRAEPREVVCCLAVLEGKDAKGIVEALAPSCVQFVCTQIPEREMKGTGRPDARSVPADELAAICHDVGAEAEAVEDPIEAWARARNLASERGAVALAAGSHYLLSCIWTERHAPSS
jgi:dihydrofolate synthase/folylpolyglutamate synthase